jgi:hypothetical protein
MPVGSLCPDASVITPPPELHPVAPLLEPLPLLDPPEELELPLELLLPPPLLLPELPVLDPLVLPLELPLAPPAKSKRPVRLPHPPASATQTKAASTERMMIVPSERLALYTFAASPSHIVLIDFLILPTIASTAGL